MTLRHSNSTFNSALFSKPHPKYNPTWNSPGRPPPGLILFEAFKQSMVTSNKHAHTLHCDFWKTADNWSLYGCYAQALQNPVTHPCIPTPLQLSSVTVSFFRLFLYCPLHVSMRSVYYVIRHIDCRQSRQCNFFDIAFRFHMLLLVRTTFVIVIWVLLIFPCLLLINH